jgi:hypothetical protein
MTRKKYYTLLFLYSVTLLTNGATPSLPFLALLKSHDVHTNHKAIVINVTGIATAK